MQGQEKKRQALQGTKKLRHTRVQKKESYPMEAIAEKLSACRSNPLAEKRPGYGGHHGPQSEEQDDGDKREKTDGHTHPRYRASEEKSNWRGAATKYHQTTQPAARTDKPLKKKSQEKSRVTLKSAKRNTPHDQKIRGGKKEGKMPGQSSARNL